MLCDITSLLACSRCGRKVSAEHVKAECFAVSQGLPKPAIASNSSMALVRRVAAGPGTELHALLRDWIGIEPTAECPCRSMAAKMDRLGPDWCEGDGMAEILGVMRDEHGKRWKARQTILPWADTGARQLVLLACKRARNKAGDNTQNTG